MSFNIPLRESGTLLIFKVKGQGHQVKFLGEGIVTLCVALVDLGIRSRCGALALAIFQNDDKYFIRDI
jgi:hypothetical protein